MTLLLQRNRHRSRSILGRAKSSLNAITNFDSPLAEEKKGATPSKFASPTPDTTGAKQQPGPISLPPNFPATPTAGFSQAMAQTPSKKLAVATPRDRQLLRGFIKRVQEVEEKVLDMKAAIDANSFNIRETKEKMAELAESVEHKASILDLKKAMGYIENFNEKNAALGQEIERLDKALKSLQDNEEVKAVKLRMTSLDNKLSVTLKNFRELHAKVTENMGLQFIPAQPANVIEDEKREEHIKAVVDDLNDKINGVRQMMQGFRKEFASLSDTVNAQLDSKASGDSLIELESRLP